MNPTSIRRALVVSLVSTMLAAFFTTNASALPFRITIHDGSGAVIDRFDVTKNNMHIDMVRIGPDGNLWIARADNSHSSGIPNPNDNVIIYSLDGMELDVISGGGMRHPLAMGWDSDGNIYISGEDNFFVTDIYKYDPAGTFVDMFHTEGWTLIDEYNDIVTTDDDRLFVSSWHGLSGDPQMTEFDTSGATIQTFSPTGPSYFHRDLALSPAGTLWARTPKNGSGDDLMREFDLSGIEVNSFSSSASVPDSNFVGLEVDAEGHLWSLDTTSQTLYEFDKNGNVLTSLPILGLSSWVTDFTFGPSGEIIVANESLPPCDGDANGDYVVDPLDSGYVLSRFGCPVGQGDPDCNAADQNNDGIVDPLDVGYVLARFGDCE